MGSAAYKHTASQQFAQQNYTQLPMRRAHLRSINTEMLAHFGAQNTWAARHASTLHHIVRIIKPTHCECWTAALDDFVL